MRIQTGPSDARPTAAHRHRRPAGVVYLAYDAELNRRVALGPPIGEHVLGAP